MMECAEKARCRPGARRDMPAGFHQTVLASSAIAAAPAYAFPRPLALCSMSANPAALADEATKAEQTAAGKSAARMNFVDMVTSRKSPVRDAIRTARRLQQRLLQLRRRWNYTRGCLFVADVDDLVFAV